MKIKVCTIFFYIGDRVLSHMPLNSGTKIVSNNIVGCETLNQARPHTRPCHLRAKIYYKTMTNRFVCNPVTYHPFRHLEFLYMEESIRQWVPGLRACTSEGLGNQANNFCECRSRLLNDMSFFFTFIVLKFTDETHGGLAVMR